MLILTLLVLNVSFYPTVFLPNHLHYVVFVLSAQDWFIPQILFTPKLQPYPNLLHSQIAFNSLRAITYTPQIVSATIVLFPRHASRSLFVFQRCGRFLTYDGWTDLLLIHRLNVSLIWLLSQSLRLCLSVLLEKHHGNTLFVLLHHRWVSDLMSPWLLF